MAAREVTSLSKAVGQADAFLRALSVRQKLLLGGGGVIVLATLLIFVKLLAKPEMKPLYTGMNAVDAQSLAAKLALRKIPYEISGDGGSISVAAEQLDAARLEIAAEGKPRSGRMGFELFDKPNWAGSDFSEKVNYQRASRANLSARFRPWRASRACACTWRCRRHLWPVQCPNRRRSPRHPRPPAYPPRPPPDGRLRFPSAA